MSNTSNPCANISTSLTSPRNPSLTPYTAIGPIANFNASATYCCPNGGTVSNYQGGDGPAQCYWMCSFNGTRGDLNTSMACNRGAAFERNLDDDGERTGNGWLGIGWHPDLQASSAAAVGGVRVAGVWKGVVWALLVSGVVMAV